VERGKSKKPREEPLEQGQEPATNSTYDVKSRIQTQATLVRGKCSRHCAIPAAPIRPFYEKCMLQVYK